MADGRVTLRPRFIDGPGGRVYTLQFLPRAEVTTQVLFLPPFAEEMNRCRSLVAEQARCFAARGYACTLLDFFGTGDSEGELADADLGIWRDNISTVLDTLRAERDVPVILWGLRLGALVAVDYASRHRSDLRDILLWQPVSGAAVFVNQMLRQRVAMLSMRGLPPETTKEIRQRLQQGERVEIAGYVVGEPLLRDIEAIDLSAVGRLCAGQVHWIEHVARAGGDIGPASRRVLEQLGQQGNRVAPRTFSGPQVWQVANRERLPELLDATSQALA